MNSADAAPPEKRDSSNRGAIVTFVVIFGLIFYVLSPVVILPHYPSGPPEPMKQILGVLFAPLEWLYDHVEIVQIFYDILFMWVVETFL